MSHLLNSGMPPGTGAVDVSDPRLVAHLVACLLALKAGRPEACLPLLVELIQQYGGSVDDVMPEMGTDDEEPYAWDTCYADDPCDHD